MAAFCSAFILSRLLFVFLCISSALSAHGSSLLRFAIVTICCPLLLFLAILCYSLLPSSILCPLLFFALCYSLLFFAILLLLPQRLTRDRDRSSSLLSCLPAYCWLPHASVTKRRKTLSTSEAKTAATNLLIRIKAFLPSFPQFGLMLTFGLFR